MNTSSAAFEDRCHLSEQGIHLEFGEVPALVPNADWLEIATPEGTLHPRFAPTGAGFRATAGALHIFASVAPDRGESASFHRVTLTVANPGANTVSLNLKWTLPLADQEFHTRWLIPALFYKDNTQQYIGLPSIAGTLDLAESRWPTWTFRADLMAVPMVMATSRRAAAALLMPERQAGHMTALGFDSRPGRQALVGAWPHREEPRKRDIGRTPDHLAPVVELHPLAPGQSVSVSFWILATPPEPFAFAPILRETFRRWDPEFPAHPWFPAVDGIEHAAHGLFSWHYDPEHRTLWETCGYERYFTKNDRYVDRFDMHVSFVSGIPYAHPLRQFGLKHNRPDMAEAGKQVINFCCENLTPWGTFWSKYTLNKDGQGKAGWASGWPQPKRATPELLAMAESGELQARTIAEAVIFAARAAQTEPDAASRALWTRAVESNLRHIRTVLRADGNPGAAYRASDGSVLEWEGDEGLHWITAFVEGHRLTGAPEWLEPARRIAAYFEPHVRDAYLTGAPEGTGLMPTSEDPQNAVMAYTNLWQATGEARWLELARLSAELLFTFRWQYNTVFPEMTILDQYEYHTKGLDISSPNNIHLHPFGLIVTPELTALWEETGDAYLIRQCRNHWQGCHQMMAHRDGVFDAPRGMMTERWYQTGMYKGRTMQLAHAWCTGLILWADLFVCDYGNLLLDGATGDLVALDALEVSGRPGHWTVCNPWNREVPCTLVIRKATGTVRAGGHVCTGAGGTERIRFTLPPRGTVAVEAG